MSRMWNNTELWSLVCFRATRGSLVVCLHPISIKKWLV